MARPEPFGSGRVLLCLYKYGSLLSWHDDKVTSVKKDIYCAKSKELRETGFREPND